MAGAAEKRVVIVSGASFGIGRGVATHLARAGYAVTAFGLEDPQPGSAAQATMADVEAALRAASPDVVALRADVSRARDVDRVVAATLRRFGRIDAVVNNAAIRPLGSISDIDEKLWDRTFAVNVRGVYLLSRTAIPHLRETRGAIVNIGSASGWGRPNMAAYSASKAALLGLSLAMSHDLRPAGVRVNLVVPR